MAALSPGFYSIQNCHLKEITYFEIKTRYFLNIELEGSWVAKIREWNVCHKKLGQLPDRGDIIEPRLIHASSLLVKISCPSAALSFVGCIQVFSYLLCLDFSLHPPLQRKSSLRSVAGTLFRRAKCIFTLILIITSKNCHTSQLPCNTDI